MTQLPEFFLNQMEALLPPSELNSFLDTYQHPTIRGLRLNPIKFQPLVNYERLKNLPSVPWCPTGRYYTEDFRPAKEIAHQAGLFYIQEPSAMCPVEVLQPVPGDRVLDLCAAPGGKSAQIAGYLQGQGLLVSNDASPTRSRALVKNLERMGVTNATVTTEYPKRLAQRFPGFFDKVLVDAPCSGEGMFRRDPDAIKAYTTSKPAACVDMQQEILRYAAQMVKPGGRLVYSTCTFNTLENEGSILTFLAENPDFTPVAIDHKGLGISPGLGALPQAGRIFPHLAQGEGHFVCLLEKTADVELESKPPHAAAGLAKSDLTLISEFYKANLTIPLPQGVLVPHGANVYLQPEPLDLSGIRTARSGWFLGECAKGRFEPSHALAMGIAPHHAQYSVDLSEADANRYLRGETLDATGMISAPPKAKPWVLICHGGLSLGWAKLVQGRLKNGLPVGLVLK